MQRRLYNMVADKTRTSGDVGALRHMIIVVLDYFPHYVTINFWNYWVSCSELH